MGRWGNPTGFGSYFLVLGAIPVLGPPFPGPKRARVGEDLKASGTESMSEELKGRKEREL